MNDRARWWLHQDPPRDDALARGLRAAESSAPDEDVDWGRLHATIMEAAKARGVEASARVGKTGRTASGEWWDVVVQWRRVAAAASVAAMLTAGALVWGIGWAAEELAIGEDMAPESVALARVVAEYPDDSVLVSFLETARNDELASWGGR